MSHIDFQAISGREISAIYDLPAAQVLIVNNTSGQALGNPMTAVTADHNGTLKIQLPAGVPAGDYYLKAQDGSGEYIAQSVVFHIA